MEVGIAITVANIKLYEKVTLFPSCMFLVCENSIERLKKMRCYKIVNKKITHTKLIIKHF